MMRQLNRRELILLTTGLLTASAAWFIRSTGYLPTDDGTIGRDYSYFFPYLLSGYYWFLNNGLIPPWFTPALCAGIPHYPNPQSLFYSLPQFLVFLFDPLKGVQLVSWSFALVGFGGAWFLARRRFDDPMVCLFVAVAFMFNGMYLSRMMVGHLTFHVFMLLPLLVFLLLDGNRGRPPGLRMIGAALIFAYLVHGGGGVILVPMLVSMAVVLLLYRAPVSVWIRAASAGVLGICLCLGKLVAVGYLMSEFPRDLYLLPGVDGFGASINVVLRSLVWPMSHDEINALVVNSSFEIGAHELDYSIPVPVAILVAGAARSLWHFRNIRMPSSRTMAVVGLLLLPVILNSWIPWLNSILKSMPYFDAVTTLVRWNLIYVLPLVILAGDCLQRVSRRRSLIAVVAAIAVIGVVFVEDGSFRGKQEYDPARVVTAWREANRVQRPPPIDRVADSIVDGVRVAFVGSADTLTQGASQLVCNEPAFGYRLEYVRFYNVFGGDVRATVDGAYNFYRPECYVYPEANACEPGDRFTDPVRLESFRQYRPIPYEVPLLQRLANWINVVALGAVLFYVGVALLMRLSARGVLER